MSRINYKKLWVKIAENEMSRAEFRKKVEISPNTLTKLNQNENVSLEEDDIIIVTGDFGIPFGGEYIEHDEKAIRLLSEQKYIVCFCDGCHDNYSMLNRIPDVEWCG